MKAITKNTLREIKGTKSRFLSIFLICVIGVGFFSGVRATCNDMKTSADDYYDRQNLFDLRAVSTFGLTDGDKSAIESVLPEDCSVYTSKYTDLAVERGDNEYLTRVYSKLPDSINTPVILEGRDIENEGECLISCNMLHETINVGDTITLVDLAEADEFPLKRAEYKVVGRYNSPMYVSMSQRGSTTIGDGALDAFMIVAEDDFTQDVYTEIYVQSETLRAMSSYSEEYENYRETLSDKLTELGKERSVIRYDEVLGEAQEKITDGEKDLAQAKTDGQKELDDAKAELENGKKEIEDGEKELAEAKEKLDDGAAQIADGEKKLSNSLAELNDGKAQLAEGKKTLDEAKEQLDEGQAKIDANKKGLADGRAQLEAAKAQYNAGLAQYNAALAELSAKEQQLSAAEQAYGKEAMAAQRAELEAAKATLAQNKAELEAAKEQIDKNEEDLNTAEGVLAAFEEAFAANLEKYNAGLAEYNENAQKIADGERAYNEGLAEFNAKKAEYEQGVLDYENGLQKIEEAKKKLADGEIEYEDGVREFNEEIAKAEKEISDAKEKISDAGKAEWYIFTRDDNVGYSEYGSNAERIDKIAAIFPVFFLLVAGLVCLTTMSRMVEEQRTQIGTIKALGYGNGAIMRHYMIYAVSGAVVGGTLGAFGGCILFPSVIMFAYSMMYTIREFHYLYEPWNMLFSIGTMTAAIALTVFFSCRKALRETPASLMRPKAPKAGKRVFLEKITFLWNKMNFFAKVSGRNLFRYKRRMFMTVIGIAGCTALSLTGFGLKDSISDIVDLQYLDINNYSGFIAYDGDAKPSEVENIYAALEEYNPETQYTRAYIKQYETKFGDEAVQCYITCAEEAAKFGDFIVFRERVSRKPLSLTDGAIISEKAATLLGAKTGDEISIQIRDGEYRSVKISGITEHYTSHYLYLSEDVYREIFGAVPVYNIVYFKNGISSEGSDSEQFSEFMLKTDKVLTVNINASSMSRIHDVMSIMDLVTIVLIVSAGALALVVLYNLTNVNITERIREIATLKVLGFYDREVSMYVFRENIVLSLIGGAVGLGLGTALCMFVIQTAEIDEVMFGRTIHPLSYLWAFLVTAAFSVLVNLLMSRVLRKISMVESLKSVE
ncbi:MAG: FtsX-like permease family protein [Oscillospiraceae bacterium]|nr:FtsX-like permease family protein [Oscillospiraceae bacterium]